MIHFARWLLARCFAELQLELRIRGVSFTRERAERGYQFGFNSPKRSAFHVCNKNAPESDTGNLDIAPGQRSDRHRYRKSCEKNEQTLPIWVIAQNPILRGLVLHNMKDFEQ